MSEISEELTGLELVFNGAATRILGLPATDAAPSEWSSHYGVLKPGTDRAFPEDEYPLVQALSGAEPRNVEMVIRNPSLPTDVAISVSARPLRDQTGAITGAVAVFRDVTELKNAHDALRRTNEQLAASQRLKEELSALVVHDLKNPIQTILGLTELLEDAGGADALQIRADAAHIRSAAERLHGMVLDLLDIQLAQDGQLKLRREDVDVREVFEEVVQALKPRAPGLAVGTMPPALDVHADRPLLLRLVSNLVDNCLKYGPPGGRIVLEAGPAEGGGVLLRVQDEGPGVPPELRGRIFEKYAQLERDRTGRAGTSRGLGLWFCHVAVSAHGGRIWVEDAEPLGARFCVHLP